MRYTPSTRTGRPDDYLRTSWPCGSGPDRWPSRLVTLAAAPDPVDDPVLLARPGAYRLSAERRTPGTAADAGQGCGSVP